MLTRQDRQRGYRVFPATAMAASAGRRQVDEYKRSSWSMSQPAISLIDHGDDTADLEVDSGKLARPDHWERTSALRLHAAHKAHELSRSTGPLHRSPERLFVGGMKMIYAPLIADAIKRSWQGDRGQLDALTTMLEDEAGMRRDRAKRALARLAQNSAPTRRERTERAELALARLTLPRQRRFLAALRRITSIYEVEDRRERAESALARLSSVCEVAR